MYTFKHFIEHDWHVLRKTTMVIRYYKITVGWIEEITEYEDFGKSEDITVFRNNQEAFDSYLEHMKSYGFKKFDIKSGNY